MLALLRQISFSRTYSLVNGVGRDWTQVKRYYESNPDRSKRIQYLHSLKEEQLNDYFRDKTYSMLSEQEIYAAFTAQKPLKIVVIIPRKQADILQQVRWDFFRCYMVRQFGWYNDKAQYVTVLGINQRVNTIPLEQLVLCLSVVNNFSEEVIKELDIASIVERVKSVSTTQSAQSSNSLIQIAGLLGDLDVDIEDVLGPQDLYNWIKINKTFDLPTIYAIHTLHSLLKVPMLNPLKQQLSTALQQTLETSPSDQINTEYLALMLEQYPQHLPLIRVQNFTGRPYLSFLQFHLLHPQINLKPHLIPQKVLSSSTSPIIGKALGYRHELRLDTPEHLSTDIFRTVHLSLSGIQSLIHHFYKLGIKDVKTQALIQIEITKALKLKKDYSPDVEERYSNSAVISTLATVCKRNMGSLDFWKNTGQWLQGMMICHLQQGSVIYPSPNNYCNLLYVFVNKRSPQHLTDSLLDIIRLSLKNQAEDWSMQMLSKLVAILTKGRIGYEDLWLLIDQMVIWTSLRQKNTPRFQSMLRQFAGCFNTMKKGTPKFWNYTNSALEDSYKRELLQFSQSTQSQVRIHLQLKGLRQNDL